MSRISETFARCKREGRAALVGYLTGFDPDRDASLERLLAAADAGLDVLELGVPFSDPNADGPRIQGAMVRALQAGATVQGVLELARAVREAKPQLPIVLFSYANPLLAFGPERLAYEASKQGVDGILVVDLPADHAEMLRVPCKQRGLDWIGLVAPTTTEARMGRVLEHTTGFVYAVTLRGVTGAALDADRPELTEQLAKIRTRTKLPIAAGFGIRTPDQAAVIGAKADGVVVGTALVEASERSTQALSQLVADLRSGLATRSGSEGT